MLIGHGGSPFGLGAAEATRNEGSQSAAAELGGWAAACAGYEDDVDPSIPKQRSPPIRRSRGFKGIIDPRQESETTDG